MLLNVVEWKSVNWLLIGFFGAASAGAVRDALNLGARFHADVWGPVLMADRMRDALPDLLRPVVQLVFIGTAAGQRSPERAPTTRRTETVFGPSVWYQIRGRAASIVFITSSTSSLAAILLLVSL